MTIRNLDALFSPRAIALLGAGPGDASIGGVLARNLLESGFKGPILPVDRSTQAIRSVLTYKTVDDLPLTPDLAVIASPAAEIPDLVAALGGRGCRAAVVISSGFGEDGDARGLGLRQAMLDAAKPHLLRIVGPNCLGLMSPAAGLNASIAHRAPLPGHIAFLTQSGIVATSVLDWAAARGIGFSHVVSLGGMSDVDFGDLLDFLESDARTRIILLYVEQLTEARKFLSAARIAARTKPVVVVKTGHSIHGAAVEALNPGAIAREDAIYDAAFRRAGMLRVDTLDALFQAVATLSSGLRVRGDRLAILTNGAGLGVIAADAVARSGARLAELPSGDGGLGNPVDILARADAARYREALDAIHAADTADAILVLNGPTALADRMAAAHAVADTPSGPRRPLLTCWLGGDSALAPRKLFDAKRIATYETPERAIAAFVQLDDYRRNQELLMETPVAEGFAIDRARAEAIVASALAEGRFVLTGPESLDLLSAFAIPVIRTIVARTPVEACAAATAIGLPVALKILSRDITHKSDVGGVHLSIASLPMVRQAAEDMLETIREKAPDARVDGFIVQPMMRRGATELVLAIAEDAVFGPVILFGEGGTATDVIGDRVVGLPPLNDVLAHDMISRTRVSRLLAGYRDRPKADLAAVATTLVKLSQLAAEMPAVSELDLNPLRADAGGVIVLDARVVLRRPGGVRPLSAIRPYPRRLAHGAATKRGITYDIRPIRPDDEAAIVDMLQRSSRDDVRLRFFAPRSDFGHSFAARLTQVDYDREMAFVAQTPGSAEISGVVRLIAAPDNDKGEFAVMVRSDLKGTGLGSLLMTEILAYARERGIGRVEGEVLRENTSMLRLVRALGFTVRSSPDDPSVVHVATSALETGAEK
ncbi:GCN5 family N-acetyltransferase [Aureimonas sp. SA4125]|uniref:bifunctional acetate--CoA ligase family protein/GNAT family N-acetyltransferase n=1 Tax=Aureimonas sp. SA4125 TaxID=2826993 RepID=UPI001CC38954|nr:bifunctional acetate--CoA ligase family protein/GNAT family N-acetyltransferase [Aureimonas sp. SA4125]BDA86984.1 GCN5 family N-acetyltransferase [Aureimonas sp. SA4125]